MVSTKSYTVEVAGKTLVVRAKVSAPSREQGRTWWDTTIQSVKHNGAELADAEFEPIAGQIESAVVDAHCEQLHEERMSADIGPVSPAVFAFFGG